MERTVTEPVTPRRGLEALAGAEPESLGHPQSARDWAAVLLDAIDRGSAPELLDVLAAIIRAENAGCEVPAEAGTRPLRDPAEELEILQGIALQMRTDLHAMLQCIYQRLEASRSYLEVVRHLAHGERGYEAEDGCEGQDPERRQQSGNASIVAWPIPAKAMGDLRRRAPVRHEDDPSG